MFIVYVVLSCLGDCCVVYGCCFCFCFLLAVVLFAF